MKITSKQKVRFDVKANVFKAMAHPTRLFIIETLSDKQYCVNELTDMIGADTSTVSKHLSILKNTGLIQDNRRGQHVYYTLRMSCALKFLSCVEEVLKEQVKDRSL